MTIKAKTIALLFLILFGFSTNAAAQQCYQLFSTKITDKKISDEAQFLINYQNKRASPFISKNDVVRYFQQDSHSLVEYTKTEGHQKYYGDLQSDNLIKKMNSIKMHNEIENSLFSRRSFQGIVFSGAHLKKDFIDSLSIVGKKINFGYFLSSSTDHTVAEGFANANNTYVNPERRKVIFVIDSKRGKPIADISEFRSENEVLFSTTAEFEVTKITDKEFKNQDVRYVSLTEVNSKLSKNFNLSIKDSLTKLPSELADWKKGLEFIFANSKSISLNSADLKKIHSIATEHMSFSKSIQRSQAISNEISNPKFSGQYRSTDADYFVSNGDHMDSSGQRYFKLNEIDGYLNNPFFFIRNVKRTSEQTYEAEAHFVAPRDIENLINVVMLESQKAVIKSKSKREYILNIFKLYKALISIHPFSDGNGRSIRLFIYSQLLKNNLPIEYFPTLGEYENSASKLAQEYVDGNQLSSRELN